MTECPFVGELSL